MKQAAFVDQMESLTKSQPEDIRKTFSHPLPETAAMALGLDLPLNTLNHGLGKVYADSKHGVLHRSKLRQSLCHGCTYIIGP